MRRFFACLSLMALALMIPPPTTAQTPTPGSPLKLYCNEEPTPKQAWGLNCWVTFDGHPVESPVWNIYDARTSMFMGSQAVKGLRISFEDGTAILEVVVPLGKQHHFTGRALIKRVAPQSYAFQQYSIEGLKALGEWNPASEEFLLEFFKEKDKEKESGPTA